MEHKTVEIYKDEKCTDLYRANQQQKLCLLSEQKY